MPVDTMRPLAIVHPYYGAIQDVIVQRLSQLDDDNRFVVDLGGGSGRLAERILSDLPAAVVCVVDQSAAFLTLAQGTSRTIWSSHGLPVRSSPKRLVPRNWTASPMRSSACRPSIILMPGRSVVCTSSVPTAWAPGGLLMNGDEVRPESDADYLGLCQQWAEHMHREMDNGRIP